MHRFEVICYAIKDVTSRSAFTTSPKLLMLTRIRINIALISSPTSDGIKLNVVSWLGGTATTSNHSQRLYRVLDVWTLTLGGPEAE